MKNDRILLKNVYLFKKFSDSHLDVISEKSDIHIVEAGKSIFNEGDPAKAFFIIKSGSIRIHQKSEIGEPIEIVVLGPGSHFGEMAFLDKAIRSASATAIEKSEVVRVTFSTIEELIESNVKLGQELFKAFAQFLCSRLRVATSDLSYAREKNLAHF
ncbi:MAG: cyclic nucleotide-binding domain-containing protein [Bdellovibrionales bacterium]